MMVEKERMLEWRQKNPKKWRDIHKKSMEKTFKKNPEKKNAWKNDYKLRKDYCEMCGSKERLEFHHLDYIKHSGITVCFNCHRYKIHNKIKKEG